MTPQTGTRVVFKNCLECHYSFVDKKKSNSPRFSLILVCGESRQTMVVLFCTICLLIHTHTHWESFHLSASTLIVDCTSPKCCLSYPSVCPASFQPRRFNRLLGDALAPLGWCCHGDMFLQARRWRRRRSFGSAEESEIPRGEYTHPPQHLSLSPLQQTCSVVSSLSWPKCIVVSFYCVVLSLLPFTTLSV